MSIEKPQKAKNLLKLIRACIDEDKYTISTHALIRQSERKINLAEIVHVLKTGYEEKMKTCFDVQNNTWKYAIKGKTKIDKLDIRVIVSLNESGMLIITVMHVGGL